MEPYIYTVKCKKKLLIALARKKNQERIHAYTYIESLNPRMSSLLKDKQ
jgi:hypothetical protein